MTPPSANRRQESTWRVTSLPRIRLFPQSLRGDRKFTWLVTPGLVSHENHHFPSLDSLLAASTWLVTGAPALPDFFEFPPLSRLFPIRSWRVTSGRPAMHPHAWLAPDLDARPAASDQPRVTRPGRFSVEPALTGCGALVDTRCAHTIAAAPGTAETSNDTRHIASWSTPTRLARRHVPTRGPNSPSISPRHRRRPFHHHRHCRRHRNHDRRHDAAVSWLPWIHSPPQPGSGPDRLLCLLDGYYR
jgi:hypothetical protein